HTPVMLIAQMLDCTTPPASAPPRRIASSPPAGDGVIATSITCSGTRPFVIFSAVHVDDTAQMKHRLFNSYAHSSFCGAHDSTGASVQGPILQRRRQNAHASKR